MKIVGCFLEYNGKFVILLRHSHKPNGDTWGLPAGKVESGESNETAILRELYEETGYKAITSQLNLLGDYEFGEGKSAYSFIVYRIVLNEPYDVQIEAAAHAEYQWIDPVICYQLPNLIPDFHDLLERVGSTQ